MKPRFALATLVLFTLAAVPVVAAPKDECAAVGILLVDLDAKKVTVIPDRLEVVYVPAANTKREICFAWFVSKGKKEKKIKKVELKDYDKLKGKGGVGDVLVPGKPFSNEYDLVSIKFDAVPVWDADGDGYDELDAVKQTYNGVFEDENGALTFDPEIIIKKPGG